MVISPFDVVISVVLGPDSKLDVVISLLAMGLYPNVCFHKEKRKVLTYDSKMALVHKSSVNCNNRECRFKSPFFVFGEKVREMLHNLFCFLFFFIFTYFVSMVECVVFLDSRASDISLLCQPLSLKSTD